MSAKVVEALKHIREGRMVILVDDEHRENEGDLICAAEKITPEIINFMSTHGKGLICLSLAGEIADALGLPLSPTRNQSPFGTAFTVSIEARHGVTTGISAQDRAHTILTAVNANARPTDLIMPGHMFPLRARPHGVFERRGQTEGSVDLARLAGMRPAGVICEIINTDGTMARRSDLEAFAEKHAILMLSIEDIVEYRAQTETVIQRAAESVLPTKHWGSFKIEAFENPIDRSEHLVVSKGSINLDKPILVRLHSECLTGDVFGSLRCDCGEQLHQALEVISNQGTGCIVYLRNHEGRGIGLANKIRAYALQDDGFDTVEANIKLGYSADERDYFTASQILKAQGLKTNSAIHLMTNNPVKMAMLNKFGFNNVTMVPNKILSNPLNEKYLRTKKEKLNHKL